MFIKFWEEILMYNYDICIVYFNSVLLKIFDILEMVYVVFIL